MNLSGAVSAGAAAGFGSAGGVSQGLAIDGRGLSALSARANTDEAGALKEAAKQFEALFMRELLKSMREATLKSDLMDNEQSDMGAELLDEQWAVNLSGLPGGLSAMIERQLSGRSGLVGSGLSPSPGPMPAPGAAPTVKPTDASISPVQPSARQQAFIEEHADAAQAVARDSGIPAAFMIGQAAHETGWGRATMRATDGAPAHNLFGIKAGAGWNGRVAEVTTTEYIDGVPRKLVARFRAYDSPEASFRDYARLITQSPRYAEVRQQAQQKASVQGFANSLQNAGYATDPEYANKLSRSINTTLAIQRAQGGALVQVASAAR